MTTFTQLPKTLASLKAANGLGARTSLRAGGTGKGMNHNQSHLATARAPINTNPGLALRTAVRAGLGDPGVANHNQSK